VVTLDIIVDLQYGDCGKGKVTHALCKDRGYTHVIRYNGGANAGHTIFHNGKKFITHHVPAGVFFGIKSIIGSGCVVDPEGLLHEIQEIESGGISTQGLLFVAKNAHIVTKEHKAEDSNENAIGTTRRGIGPAYRDKYARKSPRAENVSALKPYLIDLYEEFEGAKKAVVLAEGAQGFGLDIDWGDYPYVTSSHCTSAGALLNGFPPQSVRNIWGVAKVYETYVGKKEFEPKNESVFEQIRRVGEEYGATTGRPRQCNWIDLALLQKAIQINGVTHLVFNKMDILNTVGVWRIRNGKNIIPFTHGDDFKNAIRNAVQGFGINPRNIFFSESKEGI
jgi:adenylosuccinate synthase